MHLLIPHATRLDPAVRHALADLRLPSLGSLLPRLQAGPQWGSDEFAPDLPHELALAAAWGQAAPTPAAWSAEDRELSWAWITPVHLAVGTDGVDMLPPGALRLPLPEATLLMQSLAELWPESEGWRLQLQSPTRWLIGHPSELDGLHAASLGRVAGQPIEPWLPPDRRLRRWQNEAQMLLHGHPVNRGREARGEHAVNSLWLSGFGRASGRAPALVLDERLAAPLLGGDLVAWVEAWEALDESLFDRLARVSDEGQAASITFAGDRLARRFELRPRTLASRFMSLINDGPNLAQLLEAL